MSATQILVVFSSWQTFDAWHRAANATLGYPGPKARALTSPIYSERTGRMLAPVRAEHLYLCNGQTIVADDSDLSEFAFDFRKIGVF